MTSNMLAVHSSARFAEDWATQREKRRSVRIVGLLASGLFITHLIFTAAIRLYVVPNLTTAAHWQYGLQTSSDSRVFHEEAARLADEMRRAGWRVLLLDQFEGMSHTRVLAAVYYLAGSNSPYWGYLCNGVLFAASGTLLFALLRLLGVRSEGAAAAAATVSLGPMYLFSHSELLREPFVVFAFLIFVLGEILLFRPAVDPRRRANVARWLSGALLMSAGFVGTTTFRPYLLSLMTGALVLSILCLFVLSSIIRAAARPTALQKAVIVTALLLLVGGYSIPESRRVQQYGDESVASAILGPNAAVVTTVDGTRIIVDPEMWKAAIKAKRATHLTRADFMLPHWCTIQWQRSRWLPDALDRKFESLACARQDYLRFCDLALLGSRADRFCDNVDFDAAMSIAAHVPQAAAFALLVPLPRMWLDDFGSNGTGLRRAGYVIDGIGGYGLLIGLIPLLLRARRDNPEVLMIAAGILAILTVYGLAVPTQFILARLRLAMYAPLLAMGAAGWLLSLQERYGWWRRV